MKRLQAHAREVMTEILPAVVTIVSGQKAPMPINGPLVAQMRHMFLYGGLPESVEDYFENDNPAIQDSDISVTPVTETAWTDYEEIIKALNDNKIPDVALVGMEPEDRKMLAQSSENNFSQAQNIVILRGGVSALYLLCQALLYNFGKKPEERKLVLIQNKGGDETLKGYWTPILKAFQFSEVIGKKSPAQALLETLGVVVTTGSADTIAKLKKYGKNKDHQWALYQPGLEVALKKGAEILQITTNDQKVLDAELSIEQQNFVATIRSSDDLYALIEYVLSATEEKGTYAGNTKDKMQQAIDRILSMGAQEAQRHGITLDGLEGDAFKRVVWPLGLRHFKENAAQLHNGLTGKGALDTNALVLLTNDTGFHIEVLDADGKVIKVDLATRKEFEVAWNTAVAGKPFPGVELNHVLDSMEGAKDFFTRLKQFKEHFEAERGHPIQLRVRNISTYIAMPLAERYEDIRFISAHANVRYRVVLDPRPQGEVPLTTEHYFLPGDEALGNKTFAEMGREASMPCTADAAALRVLLRQLGVPKNRPHLQVARNAANATAERMEPAILGYDAIKKIDWNNLSASMNTLLGQAHAYVFPNEKVNLKDIDPDPVMARLKCAYVFFSVIVGRQTRQRGIHGKIFAALGLDNPAHPFAPYWRYITKLRVLNLVKQKLECILLDSQNADETQKLIHQKLQFWKPRKPSTFKGETYGKQPPKNAYHVAMLGSASTKQPAHFMEVEQFLRNVYTAADGAPLVIKYGGGRDGIMGRVHKFIRDDLRKLAGRAASFGPVYDYGIQCPETINLEGCDSAALSHKGRHAHDYFAVRKDIYLRMDEILEADAVVSFAGGAGTIQEDLHKIILKSQLEERRGMHKGQIPLVFINHDGRYDEIQGMLTEDFCKANSIHFINASRFDKDFTSKPATEQARMAADEAAQIVNAHMKDWHRNRPKAVKKPPAPADKGNQHG